MINHIIKKRLIENWGSKADSMTCRAEVRYYDPLSTWQCYVYAMNPEDENSIQCVVSHRKNERPVCMDWTIKELERAYNEHGEGVEIDHEFRSREIGYILKKLNELGQHER